MSKNLQSFNYFDDKESQNYLATCYPKGKLTAQRFDRNTELYKYILSVSTWIKIITGQLFTLAKNRDINKIDELLIEWEESVKLPERHALRNNFDGRIEALERLISKFPIYNFRNGFFAEDEYSSFDEYVKRITGIDVEIVSGIDEFTTSSFPAQFPIVFGGSSPTNHFIFVVKVPIIGQEANNVFPLPFPVSFVDPIIQDAVRDALDKVLEDVIPSFCTWTFQRVEELPPEPPPTPRFPISFIADFTSP